MSTIFERLDRRIGILQAEIDAASVPKAPTQGLTEIEPELPGNLYEDGEGRYAFDCCRCGAKFVIDWAPEDHREEGEYCFGSPRCIP